MNTPSRTREVLIASAFFPANPCNTGAYVRRTYALVPGGSRKASGFISRAYQGEQIIATGTGDADFAADFALRDALNTLRNSQRAAA